MTRKRYSIVNNATVESFAYTPPDQAHAAARILVKPNLLARPEAPGVVNMAVLGSVLRGLRRAAPVARIVVVEQGYGATSASQLFQQYDIDQILDQEMRLGDIPQMLMSDYMTSGKPIIAPDAIKDYDCVVSVAALHTTPFVSASAHNLVGLLSQSLYPDREALLTAESLQLIQEAFAPHIDGAVVVVNERVLWSDDMSAVDAEARRIAGIDQQTHSATGE